MAAERGGAEEARRASEEADTLRQQLREQRRLERDALARAQAAEQRLGDAEALLPALEAAYADLWGAEGSPEGRAAHAARHPETAPYRKDGEDQQPGEPVEPVETERERGLQARREALEAALAVERAGKEVTPEDAAGETSRDAGWWRQRWHEAMNLIGHLKNEAHAAKAAGGTAGAQGVEAAYRDLWRRVAGGRTGERSLAGHKARYREQEPLRG